MKDTHRVERGDRRAVLLRHRVRALALVSAMAALAPITAMASVSGAEAPPAGPGYLTIQFGRSIEGSYLGKGCVRAPGFLTLAEVAADLQARGFSATTTVVVDRTGSTTERCQGGDIYASWPDLQALAADGWSFISDGMTHNDIVTMSRTGQMEESCGSLAAFTQHGLDGSGLFAYGDNKFSTAIQKSIVEECYMYGRTYRGGVNNRATMSSIGFQNTNSITGGACNTVGHPCYTTITGQAGKHYMSPVTLATLVAGEKGDRWIDLQFYLLVSGVEHNGAYSWDCTSPDWTLHWTSQTEMYCANDFDSILDSVPAGIVVTDPGTVGTAWGRSTDN
jgi:hypothetical protein